MLAIIGLASVSAILIPTYAVPSIRSADIVDHTIQSVDIASGTLKLKTHFVDETTIVEVGQAKGLTVSCPSGEQVTGGGYSSDPDMSTYINSPSEGASGIATGWQVAAQNNGNQDHGLVAFVMCAQPFP